MQIQMIALDLDDTLLGADLGISEKNRDALREAEDAGIEIVLASGRNYYSMKKYCEFLGLDHPGNYLICANGAETIRAESGDPVEALLFAPEFCHSASAYIEARGFPWQVYRDGKIYCNEINAWTLRDEFLTGQKAVRAEDMEELFGAGLNKFVVPGAPERIAVLYAEMLEKYAGIAEIVTSKPYFLEILPPGASKGAALSRLASKNGIPMSAVLAIGDAMNDLSMIQAAGWGCAPANAVPEIREAARFVSEKTNDEDAVADIVRRIALGEGRREKA